MLTRKSVRSALHTWKRTEALGQHPLASLSIVETRRGAAGYPATPVGRGMAVRDVLRDAIEALRPDNGPSDVNDDRWRLYIILTEQYVEGQAPGCVAEQLSIAQPTYHHAQAKALDALAAILREREERVSPLDQEWPPSVAAVAGQGLEEEAGRDEAPEVGSHPLAAGARPSQVPGLNDSQAGASTGKVKPIPSPARWLFAAFALSLVLVAWLVWRQRAAEPRPVVATISLTQSSITRISANPLTQRVYADLEDVSGIAVIDATTNTVLATISTAGYHSGIAVDPTTNRIYIAQQFAGTVRVIDGADNRVLADLPVPGLVHTVGDVAVDPVTQRLYVIRTNNNDVAVFDTTTDTFLDAIPFGPPSAPGCPSVPCRGLGMAVNPATNRIYVVDAATSQVVVIDGASRTVIARASVGKTPQRISVNPVTNLVYVTDTHDGSVAVIDGTSYRVVATIPVGAGPSGIVVNPDTNRVFVANSESKTVSIIDGASNLVIATVPLDAPASFAALMPGSGRIYVTGGEAHTIKVIEDTAAHFVAWTPLAATGGPPTPRGDTANRPAGYDPVHNRMLFFGGMKQGGLLLNDTWVLANADGTSGAPQWLELATANTPPPRRSHAGAYDAASNRLITYGGCLGGCTPIDNHVYVLSHANGLGGIPTWQQLEPTGDPPPPRNGHSAVYDPTSNRLIVFGGDNCCGQRYDDTWVLTHANGLGGQPAWMKLTPTGGPPPGRAAHSAVYDVAHNRIIVFGGATARSPLNDVWVLSGANGLEGTPTWSQLAPTGVLPAERGGHSAVYDQASGQMLVFGGGGTTELMNDSWLLSHANGLGGAAAWTQLMPWGTAPTARASSSGVYRAATNRLIIVAGDTLSGSLNDTWTLVNAIPGRR